MEQLLIMETGSESLQGAMWLTNSLSPTYQDLSPGRSSECDTLVGQQVGLDYFLYFLSLRGQWGLLYRPRLIR